MSYLLTLAAGVAGSPSAPPSTLSTASSEPWLKERMVRVFSMMLNALCLGGDHLDGGWETS